MTQERDLTSLHFLFSINNSIQNIQDHSLSKSSHLQKESNTRHNSYNRHQLRGAIYRTPFVLPTLAFRALWIHSRWFVKHFIITEIKLIIHANNNPFLCTHIMDEYCLSKILKQAKRVSSAPIPSISSLAFSVFFLLPAALSRSQPP